ncbi:hypothetical protein KGM_208632B, partial [Danaus plexippus plexippus]
QTFLEVAAVDQDSEILTAANCCYETFSWIRPRCCEMILCNSKCHQSKSCKIIIDYFKN